MAGLGLLVVLVLILVCVPLCALIWGQKERRPQTDRKISRTSRVSILSRVDPKRTGRHRQQRARAAIEHRPGRRAGIELGLPDHFPRLDPVELDSRRW